MKVVLNEHDLKVDAAQYIYSKGIKALAKYAEVCIDCEAVDDLDSTGIAVLCAWWQYASVHEVVCEFKLSVTVQEMLLRHGIELP